MTLTKDNFIADACILLASGLTAEEVYSLIDHAIGLVNANSLDMPVCIGYSEVGDEYAQS